MEQILTLRETIITNFKKYEPFILFGLKFLLGLVIYNNISQIGFVAPMLQDLTNSGMFILVTLFLAFLFAIMPFEFSYFLIILSITLQFSASIEVAIIVFMVLMLCFCFYAHLGTKESVILIFIFFAYSFNMPYIIPIFAGFYLPLLSIIPITLGTILWHLLPLAIEFASRPEIEEFSFVEIPALFSEVYTAVLYYFENSSEIGVYAFVLILIFFVVYIVSNLRINYKKEVAIICGVVSSILFFTIAVIFTSISINIFALMFFSVISGAIMYIISFFDSVLDYKKAEHVEFYDDDYYYNVKMVPKVNIQTEKIVRRPKRPNSKRR